MSLRADVPAAVQIGRRLAETARRSARVRLVRIALRFVIAGAAAALALLAAGPGPAGLALVTGSATWLVLAVRRDTGWRS